MKRVLFLLILAAAGSGCRGIWANQSSAQPAATVELQNASFDDGGDGLSGWSQQGDSYGRATVVIEPVASGPGALEMTAQGPGSSGNDSFMVFQVLDPARYRGRRVHFGAKVRTNGGAVNITMYTPQRFTNDFYQELHSGRYVDRRKTFDVPKDASFLSFGIQIMGPARGQAYVDDAFVTLEEQAVGLGLPPLSPPRGSGSATAEVRIEADKPGRAISPLLFGMHLEWAESGNGVIDRRTRRLRTEVVGAFTELQIPLFRFPGGIHADYYDWQNGVQAQDERRDLENVFTRKAEPHLFGSPEFVELLKSTGAEALVTANYGTGTAAQAAAWARYFKSAGTPVRYWEVGNEIYLADPGAGQPNGKRIAKSGRQYAEDFPKFREAIRAVTPAAKVGLIGHIDSGAFPLAPASRRNWTTEMLGALRSEGDFVAVHNAYAPVIIDNSNQFADADSRARAYRALYAGPLQTADDLTTMASLLDRTPTTRGLPIAITEWGPLFGYSGRPDATAIYADQSRTMAAAIYVASVLDVMIGNPRVLMATYTNPVHKWYGSLLTDTDGGLVRTPSYHVVSMYRRRFEARLVPVTTTTGRFESTTVGLVRARADVPEVVAHASTSEDHNRLTVMLVNRSLDRAVTTRVMVAGFTPTRVDCLVLSATSPNAINGPSLTKTTATGRTIQPERLSCQTGTEMTISVPASGIVSIVAERG